MNEPVYPLQAVRTLALYAQGLCTEVDGRPAPTMLGIQAAIERIGCVQIDTLQMVQRSQYLVLWSRLGNYDTADLDRLAYDAQHRSLFEGWQHAACLIPLSEFRYQIPHMRQVLQDHAASTRSFLAQPGGAEIIEEVRERIRANGALRGADFEYSGPKRGSWWDWKPAKEALEYLYASGELMIAERRNFQRVYDLTERVLPEWVDQSEPTAEERDRHWVELGVRALGACTMAQAGAYSFRTLTAARAIINELLREGIVRTIQAQLADGETHELIVHKEHMPILEQAAQGELSANRTTFLSPFDSLFWASRRDRQFWGFRQSLEAYLPAHKRQWGYYCLPILYKDRLVGRFDPKLERKQGILRLKALYLEAGVQPEEQLVKEVAGAMTDFMAFHNARELVIENSQPQEFGQELLAGL